MQLSQRTGGARSREWPGRSRTIRARHAGTGWNSAPPVAAPKANALLLVSLPVLGLAMGSGVGADPWECPHHDGHRPGALLVAGVALELAGLAWTSRLVRRVLP